MSGLRVRRVDACDIEVEGVRYCVGQFETTRDAVSAYREEAARFACIADFLESEAAE